MLANRLPDGRVPVLLSSHAEELLARDAEAILAYLDRAPDVSSVAAVAAMLVRTRRVRRHRAVIRAGDRDELTAGLRALIGGQEHPLLTRTAENANGRLAFVFPGQGNQWPGMGAEAYRLLPAYRDAADECAAAFESAGLASPLRYLLASSDVEAYTEVEIEGAQFVHAVGLARVWRACGIVADLTVGHSLGEFAAAYIAEGITLADAVAVIGARAGVVDWLQGSYAVAALGIDVDTAAEVIAETDGWLELSVVNAPSSVAISGDRAAVSAAVDTVRGRGQFGREITVGFPVHTSVLEPLRDAFQQRLPRSEFADTAVQFIGGTTGDVVAPGTSFAEYWYRNLRQTVRFDAAVASALRRGATTFVEVSAHPALLYAMGEILDRDTALGNAVIVGSGRRDQPLAEALSANVVTVAVGDPGYRWGELFDPGQPMLPEFPNAPMRAVHMWAGAEPLDPVPSLTVAAETWREYQVPQGSPRSVAILEVGEVGDLAAGLRGAVARHPSVSEVDPQDADMVVLIAPAIVDTDIERTVAELTELVAAGALNYADAIGPRCRDVWLITTGGEVVYGSDDAVAVPGQAALAAIHRSIGFEHPDQAFHHLDLARHGAAPDAVLVGALLGGAGELATRGATVFRRHLADPPPAAPAWRLDSGLLDNVVITGGAGAIGMHYTRYFAEHGAKRIVLLGRRGADAGELAALADRYGTEVLSARCDVTQRDQVAAVAAEFAGDGATLVVHAAGTAIFQTRDDMTADAFADTMAAKVTGLTCLAESWPLRAQARILLCSSVIGLWGGKGTAAYAAANRLLDVQAAQLRAAGTRCVAVRWGLWESGTGTGIVDADETARVARTGLLPMPPREAIEASLADHAVNPLVLRADADRLQRFLDSQVQAASAVPADPTPADPAEAVRLQLAAVLDISDPATVADDASLFDLGIDSLLALDLRKRMTKTLGAKVPLARLLSGITVGELIAEVEQKVEFSRD